MVGDGRCATRLRAAGRSQRRCNCGHDDENENGSGEAVHVSLLTRSPADRTPRPGRTQRRQAVVLGVLRPRLPAWSSLGGQIAPGDRMLEEGSMNLVINKQLAGIGVALAALFAVVPRSTAA